ncbi:MAG: RrF2 family transcriptional regulator [Gemmataceae bacterium]
MKITAQEEYGLRCLLRLARSHGDASPTIPEIAQAENLSGPYVAKLLGVLKQAGLIESVRGRSGGYHLSRPPEEIKLGSVLLALGEPLFDDPGYCDRHAGPETVGPCVHQHDCSLKGLWQTLERWMRHILDQVTLRDLLRQEIPVVKQLQSMLPEPEEPLLQLAPLSRGAGKRLNLRPERIAE